METKEAMQKSYFATMFFFILHEIDAAFWREWEMFLIPGGIQGFLVFNIILLPIVIWGYRHVVLSSPKALSYAYLCAGLGLLTFLIHTGFFLAGYEQFELPLSIAVIFGCLLGSLWQFSQIKRFVSEQQLA